MPPPVVPPPPPERRALGRAAVLAVGANLLACSFTVLLLSGALPGGGDVAARARALDELGLLFRIGWMTWVPASLSFLVFLVAWARAVRPGGLAGAAVPLATVAVACDLLAETFYGFALPRALAAANPVAATALVDAALLEWIGLPANLGYAGAFLLLALRSHRRRALPAGLVAGLAPFLAASLAGAAGTLAGSRGLLMGALWAYFPAILLWWVALARWCATVDPRA